MTDPERTRAPRPIRTSPNTPGRPGGYPRTTPGSMFESSPSRTSTQPVTSHLDGRAARPHRRLDGHQHTYDAAPEVPAGQRDAAGLDGVHEFHALVLQRFARLDLRAHDVAVAHEQLELAIGFRDPIAGG